MELGLLGCRDDIVHTELPLVVSIADVLYNAAVEQNWLLGNNSNLGAQEWNIDASGLMSINQLENKAKTKAQLFLKTARATAKPPLTNTVYPVCSKTFKCVMSIIVLTSSYHFSKVWVIKPLQKLNTSTFATATATHKGQSLTWPHTHVKAI